MSNLLFANLFQTNYFFFDKIYTSTYPYERNDDLSVTHVERDPRKFKIEGNNISF